MWLNLCKYSKWKWKWKWFLAIKHAYIFHFILIKINHIYFTSFSEILSSVGVVLLSSPLFAMLAVVFFSLRFFFSNNRSIKFVLFFFYRFVAEIFNPQFRLWFMRWHATEGKSIFHLSFFRCHVNHNSWLSETKKNGKKDGKMSSLISYFIVHGNSNRTEKVLNLLFMCDFSPSKKTVYVQIQL